ncbi:unconventional myosin 10A isoform X3 [Lycorma delicatula]|uniref:unconventional myosin 10A isoform X3 n=1 Tax=Lycorma delicatula TaxID=130591 RepID=UPI003F513A10
MDGSSGSSGGGNNNNNNNNNNRLRSVVIEPWLRLTNRSTSWATYNPCCSIGKMDDNSIGTVSDTSYMDIDKNDEKEKLTEDTGSVSSNDIDNSDNNYSFHDISTTNKGQSYNIRSKKPLLHDYRNSMKKHSELQEDYHPSLKNDSFPINQSSPSTSNKPIFNPRLKINTSDGHYSEPRNHVGCMMFSSSVSSIDVPEYANLTNNVDQNNSILNTTQNRNLISHKNEYENPIYMELDYFLKSPVINNSNNKNKPKKSKSVTEMPCFEFEPIYKPKKKSNSVVEPPSLQALYNTPMVQNQYHYKKNNNKTTDDNDDEDDDDDDNSNKKVLIYKHKNKIRKKANSVIEVPILHSYNSKKKSSSVTESPSLTSLNLPDLYETKNICKCREMKDKSTPPIRLIYRRHSQRRLLRSTNKKDNKSSKINMPPKLSDLCVQVLMEQPQVFSLTSTNGVRRRQDLGQNGIEDMIQLSDLNEASLLWNLKIRYDKEFIYTYVGSILIAVNPYKMYDMYGLDVVKRYEGQILGTLPPHLFAIGSAAYSALSRCSQVVVISGESGSGKTESTKLVMQYLAAVNKSPSNLITEQILEASPLLESFGNAKTVRNDNSSRFGKFLEVHFKDGVILGAKVTEYLLEKSRIVTQAPDERNYHVFYELLAGLSEETKLKYGLLSADKYFYLNQGGSCEIDGKYDSEDFQSLLSAMQVLGFTSEEQDTIFRILASVLHLGNVYFHRKQLKHGQEGVEIGSDAEIRWTGHLLQLSVDGIKQALTTKTTEARNERLLTALSIDQALDARDAFAKALYSSLFAWLVARINHIVYKGTKKTTAISILDIFGFEDFKENSFEQLCINYANENLQFYFNKHIFKLEQQEYAKEKIVWQNITYSDNLPVIHLLSKKPVGILHLLDDESNFPRATDLSFLEKCHYNHALNELYSRPRLNGPEFGIRHFAGPVWYNVEGFLDKNRDTLRPDVVELLISSSLPMLSKMFVSVRGSQEASKTLNKSNGRFITMKPRTPTVAARFHDSLQQLLESMSKCNPWFVRCIKPNNDKAAMKFDMPIVLEQLRYSGMLETIRIRKVGYPIRIKFQEFAERYRYLLPTRTVPPRGTPSRELCNLILERHGGEYQLGTTKVFLRENLERALERDRAAILRRAAIILQQWVRGFLARKHYQMSKKSAIKLQSAYRGWRERKKYITLRRGIVKAQAHFRGKRQRRRYTQLKEEMKRRAEMARERAKVKAQKEEQEKANRTIAVAGVNHLDIPAELAFIFNKIEEWQPVHNERQLVKVVGSVVEKPEPVASLPSDIDQHAFSKFTNIYFKSHVWGMKREPIKTPFLNKAKDSDFTDSLALFKLILRFMNDDSLGGKKEQVLGDYIAYKGISNEKLRDEILCQLVNQTWRNDIAANCERGWLLMANCLSVFPPSSHLYKFLLKYVSDHGYNGYKAICQQKLLMSHNQWPRTYPPNLLEWRANRKRVNMALQLQFADGESVTCSVDSWTRCETLCAAALTERGVAECHGWTISLEDQGERNGLDYIMDAISEMELPPGFPLQQQQPPLICTTTKVLPEPQPAARRPTVPPPQPPQQTSPVANQMKVRSVSRDHTTEMGLSRQSALNDRYFDKPGRSRSLDNLLSPVAAAGSVPCKLDSLGLSHSRLNERYHSMERIQEADNVGELTKAEEDNLESVSQRGENRKYSLTGASSDVLVSHSQLEFDFAELTTRSEDDKGSYIRGHPRFIKSQYAGKRAAPGSHSSRGHIEARNSDKSESGVKSSALSDTSEAPSLASHVRRVRVPSQASDVDQFLDDLFSPVLDQLSDARSLAASIKGGSKQLAEYEHDIFQSLFDDDDLCLEASELADTIKGGGQGVGGVGAQEPATANQPTPMFSLAPMVGSPPPVMPPLMPPTPLLMPLYNTSGLSIPTNQQGQAGNNDPNIMAYQANLHRAFLQSAMAQNFQIQQQLLAQNQALQQLLQQQTQPQATESQPQWASTPNKAKSTPVTTKAQVHRSGSPGSPQSAFTNVLSELKSRKSSVDSTTKSVVPPPPPMPPPPDLSDPSEARPFMDPYGRAKTVRIGKWRWPPPKDDNSADTSFLQFKLKQRRKHSQDLNEVDGVEWEEFEIPEHPLSQQQNSISKQQSPPQQNHHQHQQQHQHQHQQHQQQPEIHRNSMKSLEVGASRPSPGSVGKLRISSEMKSKLERVTANHSLRSTTKSNNHPPPIPNMNPPTTGKLDSDRRLLLQQQLAGRWGSIDSVDGRGVTKEERSDVQQTNILRSQLQVERMEKGPSPGSGWRPPPPPVTPHPLTTPSRSSSFYSHSNVVPPAPIQPVTRDLYGDGMFGGSMSTQHSDHVELEESSEFLAPVEPLPPQNPPEAVLATKLHTCPSAAHFSYNRISWKLNVRKEVFSPKESISSPLVLHLVFCQVVTDVLNKQNPRINKDERSEMIQLLERFHVTAANMQSAQHKASTKRAVVDMARHWLTYFSRLFPVSGGNHYPDVQMLAVSHLGIRLARPESNQLRVIHTIKLDEIADVGISKGGGSLQLVLSSGERFPLYTNRARHIQSMLNAFTREAIGTANTTINRELHQARVEERSRPVDHKGWHADTRLIMPATPPQHQQQPMVADDGKHSLLQFAMHHFRQSPEKFEMLKTPDGNISGSLKVVQSHKKSGDWTWKEQVDLVKYTPNSITESLLKLDQELNQLAIECFECAMRYMGDLPTTPDLTEVKCVYTILMHCHKHEALRDEVYCQLMKQTTSNKSDSCQRGWRLLSIVAAYFTCSDTLKPFLLKYLETAAYDKRRAFHGTANVCLQNLRKTLRYGGRKNVPSVEEVTAVSAGRNSKRQLYRLPGGSETVINTKSTTVVNDVIQEMCSLINVHDPLEMEEFSLYCIVEGDAFTMPLSREEYILDVTTELHKNQQIFYLIFCRSVWHFPLRLDCQLYVQVLFNQIAPDYLEGLLLVLPNEQLTQEAVYEVAKLAALLHRAADMTHAPAMKETKFLLPKPALTQRDIKPAQWVQLVQSNWPAVQGIHSIQAKAQLLELLSKWPLFGSSFFAVKRGGDQQILALNRSGVHFLHLVTHETLSSVPYSEVISTRKVRAESGTMYLELKCGNLFQQRVARLQTDQAHEIARLIRQYMSLHRQQLHSPHG